VLTLSLFRHTKSSWDNPKLKDHDRPLSARGEHDAPRMGAFIAAQGLIPERVLCSTAARTRATLALAMPAWSPPPVITFDKALYLADWDKVLLRLQDAREPAAHMMLIGHNPGLQDLAATLIGRGNREERMAIAQKFPTAALAVIRFETAKWADVVSGSGRLDVYMAPRRLE
jgi:phosphohistidine phosphatase